MKMIVALIQPTKLTAVQQALTEAGVDRMTVCDAQGFGQQRGQNQVFRGHEYQTNFLRKVELEIVVNDDYLDRTIDAITSVARTGPEGSIGDGKIFVLPVEETIRISQTVRGPEAV